MSKALMFCCGFCFVLLLCSARDETKTVPMLLHNHFSTELHPSKSAKPALLKFVLSGLQIGSFVEQYNVLNPGLNRQH